MESQCSVHYIEEVNSTLPHNFYVFRQRILTHGHGLLLRVESDALIVRINSNEYMNMTGQVICEFPPTEHDLHVVVEANASRLCVDFHLGENLPDEQCLQIQADQTNLTVRIKKGQP